MRVHLLTAYNHQKHLTSFPESGHLEFVAMDVLGPLPRMDIGNQFIVVMADRFSKLPREVTMTRTAASHIASALLDHWNNGLQLVETFFSALCGHIGSKKLKTTAYHPHTNGQTESYNSTISTRLLHYVAEHKADWDMFVQPLMYAYRNRAHRSTTATTFSLMIEGPPTEPTV